MADYQHDYVIDNQSGASFRGDLNNCLQAIVRLNAGSGTPGTIYPYMLWVDENTGLIKQATAASGFVTIGQAGVQNWGLVSSGTAASTYLPLTGGTITGAVTIGSGSTLSFEGATDNIYETIFAFVDPTSDRTITFPDATGTVPLLSNAQTYTAAQRGAVSGLTSASGITIDLSIANNFSLTMGHTVTLNNPSNIVAGQSGVIFVTQPASGTTYAMVFDSYWDFAGGQAPSLTQVNGATDVIVYAVRSATSIVANTVLNIS